MTTILKRAVMATVAVAASFVSDKAYAAMPGSGGTWTIASGESETVYENDMASYNALAKVVVNGSLTFSDVSTAPAVVIEGAGTCTKTGSADWTLSTACPSFTGTWDIKGGTVDASVAQAFGSYLLDKGDLYIRDGATLKLTTAPASGYFYLYQRIHIAGAGVDGNGAIWSATSTTRNGYIGNIILEGDATINMPSGTRVDLSYGTIDLRGYILTFTGGQTINFNNNETFTGPGTIVMDTGVKFDFQQVKAVLAESEPRIKIVGKGDNRIRMIENSSTCPWPEQYADLDITGTFTLVHSHKSVSKTPSGHSLDHNNIWHGNVTFSAASDLLILSCDATAKNCMLTMDGNASGAGSVQIFQSGSDGYARIALEGTNTFAGATTAYLSNQGAAILGNSNSVPDYASFTATGGRVTLRIDDDGSRWCTNSIARFVDSATLNSGSVIGLDSSMDPDGEATISGEFWKGVKSGSQPVLVGDGGTNALTGPLDDKYYHFGAIDGALKFTGDKTIKIGESYSYSGPGGECAGTLLFENATDIHHGADGSDYGRILLPGCPGFANNNTMLSSAVGRMVVSNAKIVNDMLASNPEDVSKYVVRLGTTYGSRSYPGILEIRDGADMTDRIVAGSGASEAGAIYHSGGTFRNIGKIMSSVNRQTETFGLSGYAFYMLSSTGAASFQGRYNMACGAGSEFVLMQTGGSFAVEANEYDTGTWTPWLYTGSGRANLYVGGGTWSCGGKVNLVQGAGGSAVFTVAGNGTSAYAADSMSCGLASAAGTVVLNLNGGTLDVANLSRTSSSECKVHVNGNGGTLQTRSNNSNFGDGCTITAYSGGFAFSDNAVGNRTTFVSPIEAPSGNGVSAVSVPAELAGETLVGAPLVEISETGAEGEGFGASAVALFDKATGRVTGVQVTSPGCDYTEATATFHYADKTWTSVCTLAANTESGGFTKKGPGQLTFSVANTYGGATVVEQGGLIIGCDWAIPEGSELILNGGNIALGSYECSFKSIGGSGGNLGFTGGSRTFSVESLVPGTTDAVVFNGSTLTVTGETRFDAAKLLAGETTTYGTDVAFASGATIAIDNLDLLDDADESAFPIVLMTVASGYTVSGAPEWTNKPESGSYEIRFSSRSVRIVKDKGFMLIVR